jgi:hypothetical protein
MLKKIIGCLLVFTTFAITLKAQGVPKLRIDPAQAYGGVVGDYFDEVNYIPLQTTKESLFGAISNMIVTDSSYVISDNDTRAVLFFKKDGTYITKVKLKKDEYPGLSHETSTKRILITFYNAQTEKRIIQYYSLSGVKLEDHLKIKSSEKDKDMTSLGGGYYLNTESCYFEPGKKPVDSVIYALSIYKNEAIYKSFLPFNAAITPGKCALGSWPNITPSNQDSVVYVSIQYDNTIYRVTKDTVQKIYTLVFPFNRMFAKDLLETTDPKQIDSLRDNSYKMTDIISGVSNIYFEGDLLLFKIDQRSYQWTQGTEDTKQYNLIYNLKTGRLVSLERITPDERSSFLPLMAGFYTSLRGLIYNEGYFYSHVPSLHMFAAKENTKAKNPKYSNVMEKYFKTEDRKSNPVIVQMKLK